MIDREHVLVVLRRRFRGAGAQQFAEAANAIVALPDEWEEVRIEHARAPIERVRQGAEVRIFRKRSVALEDSRPDSGPGRFM